MTIRRIAANLLNSFRPAVRRATRSERRDVTSYLAQNVYGGSPDAPEIVKDLLAGSHLVVVPRYQSDSPGGYAGRVLVALHSGGPDCAEVYVWDDNGAMRQVPL